MTSELDDLRKRKEKLLLREEVARLDRRARLGKASGSLARNAAIFTVLTSRFNVRLWPVAVYQRRTATDPLQTLRAWHCSELATLHFVRPSLKYEW